jgi:acyl-coenzyme A synthetase/AMP-(fatty) acid ligase
MDFSRPASADPGKLLAAANRWKVTQSFASPAVWDRLSRHCEQTGETIPTLRHLFSCGAPVPETTIRRTLAAVHPEARLHTPYGATECLPVSTIEAADILGETAAATDRGNGVCVGQKVDSIDWRVIEIADEPIPSVDEATPLATGEIGELIVRGPQASRRYLAQGPEGDPTPAAKIVDGQTVWHRMGDVGYLDADGRFWYCGRKSQRVMTSRGTLYTECVEGIANTHPQVNKSALVGIGPRDAQTPIVVLELASGARVADVGREVLALLRQYERSRLVERLLVHPQLPTDIRHNAKIQREALAIWAANSEPTASGR